MLGGLLPIVVLEGNRLSVFNGIEDTDVSASRIGSRSNHSADRACVQRNQEQLGDRQARTWLPEPPPG
jgi:hypothetical protein